MNYKISLVFLFFLVVVGDLYAQSDEELAYQKALRAIKLMDEGKYDESIEILEECEKLDKTNSVYPYEIALAYTYKEEHQKAIRTLEKIVNYEGINSQVYQLLGNNYSFSGEKEEALNAYYQGLEKFPNAGNLYLEIGNIHAMREDYLKAIESYEKGVAVAPQFASNYYHLSKLFLNSNDRVAGLIYREIFMNLERTTERTMELSELLFDTYDASITLYEDSSRIDFCEIIIDASALQGDELKLPFCAIFGKNFVLSIINHKEVNLKSLSEMRSNFIDFFFQSDAQSYPNILFEYHRKIKDNGLFDAYNHYLFQIARPEEFETWYNENTDDYNSFVEWYTTEENIIKITEENRYLRY